MKGKMQKDQETKIKVTEQCIPETGTRRQRKDLNNRCKAMEEEGNKGRNKEIFSKVKEITRKFIPRMGSLKSRVGKVIGDKKGMKNRWKEYSEELHSEDKRIKKEQSDMTEYKMEPEVMEAEVEWAIKQLKDDKATEQNGIVIKADEKDYKKNMQQYMENWKMTKRLERIKIYTYI